MVPDRSVATLGVVQYISLHGFHPVGVELVVSSSFHGLRAPVVYS